MSKVVQDIIRLINSNPEKYKVELQQMIAESSLVNYVELMWHILEPSRNFCRGWHIDCICDHLSAIAYGEIHKLLINVPPGSSKPVYEESRVITKNGCKTLKEVVVGDEILTHMGRFRKVSAVYVQGELPTLTIHTYNGRELTLAFDHPVLTTRGWVQAKDLTTDDLVCVVHQEESCHGGVSKEEARLIGYLVGDGCTSYPSSVKFTNQNEENIKDFMGCAEKLGFYVRKIKKYKNAYDVLIKPDKNPWYESKRGENPLHALLRKHDLFGENSYTKKVSNAILSSSNEVIANFLGAYWSCDGCTKKRTDTNRITYKAFCSTVSIELAKGVQSCLNRLGIDCYLRTKKTNLASKKQPGGIYVSYEVVAKDQDNVAKFKNLPICREKLDCIEKANRQSFDSIWFADKVESIEETGLKKCRCLTVDEDHSFTANDIAVHNSLLTRVFFPSWIWGPKNMPYKQFLGFSYAQSLSERDNVKFRKLIQSPEYKSIWGNRFSLVKDTNNKRKFSNDKNGFSEATSTDGTGTGLRADIVVIDDPHSVKQANSDADLNRALLWFRETLPTRVNSLENSATVVIMQRVSERDVSGEILSNDLGYEHVMIPMMFEPERKCYTVVHPGGHKEKDGSLYLWDKREKEGDLMCPELFPEKAVAKLVQTLGSYATAGQLQQRPVPREGALFKTSDIQYIDFENVPEGIEVRGWDLAGSSSSKSPFTAGAKLRFDSRGNFYIMDVLRFRGAEKRVVTIMRNTAEKDGIECIQDFPQDPGQAGKGQAVFITEQLAGYVVKSSVETGSKTLRADAMATQASIGKMFIVRGPWNKEFVDELTTFPGSRFKDQVDACSRAFHQGLKLINLDNNENICAPVSI